ncbi:MAG TPA: 5-carboxymethyl-2-hydroxymuconate Delta-isomerase [Pyrinomonadaceae bacterium]|nr:5-carboxymethyl-2-hydroxymuconate Delta-isomerase [Pyrinomonadaceae bacterium]
MPHFVIDCSPSVLTKRHPDEILKEVHRIADDSGLFDVANIKVRIREYEHYLVAGERSDFVHVFANVLEGRTVEQKAALSRAIVERLTEMLPDVPVISINMREFEKATYINRGLL